MARKPSYTFSSLRRLLLFTGLFIGLASLSNANTPIEVNIPAETGIQIAKVKLNASSSKFDGASFEIRNVSDRTPCF